MIVHQFPPDGSARTGPPKRPFEIAQHSAASEVDRAEAAETMRRERLKEERAARERDRAGSRAPREGVGVAPRTGKDDAA